MRDLVVFFAMAFFLHLAFINVFVAFLIWGWSGLIGLNYYIYGFMSSVSYTQLYAAITLMALFFYKSKEKSFSFNRTTKFFLIFALHGFFCASLAYSGLVSNWEIYTTLLKTMLFCILMPALVTNRFGIHSIVLMIVLGISFHGVLDGLKFISSAGSHKAQSIGKFGDNNYLGMIVLMGVPFLFYLVKYSSNKISKYFFAVVLFLNILTIVATQSRGALSGSLVIAFLYILNTKRKFIGIVFLSFSVFFISEMATDSWKTRMQSIQTAQEDSSFLGRVRAWQVSSAIALGNPVFGGGFRAVQSHPVWNQFKYSAGILPFVEVDTETRSGIAAHSIWFEVLGDQGFVGLFLFLLLIINAFLTRRDIKKLNNTKSNVDVWAMDLANVTVLSLIAYCFCGSLLSAAYFELPYVCFMLLEVIKIQQKNKNSIKKYQ